MRPVYRISSFYSSSLQYLYGILPTEPSPLCPLPLIKSVSRHRPPATRTPSDLVRD